MTSERVVINGEPCELVTEWSSLHAGALVYYIDCGICGAIHRGLLRSSRGVAAPCGADLTLPATCCSDRGLALCQCSVANGRVYRVVLDLSEKVAKVRELAVVR